jgi:hypothetical protein
MKRSFALAVMAFASQAAALFAGEPMVSSKQVIEPPAPPVSYFGGGGEPNFNSSVKDFHSD